MEQSIRLFKSSFLEWFSHVHPATPFVIWIPITLFFTYRAAEVHQMGLASGLAIAFAGLLFWTFFEYMLHRFMFHFPAKNKIQKRIVFIFHGIHHDAPNDGTRLVMPPAVSLSIGLVMYFAAVSFLGAAVGETAYIGFIIGYMAYDFIHYATHHFRPRTKVGKFLKQYHMDHHFQEHEAKWGVSNPLWDYVFGTVGKPPKIN